MGSSVDVLLGMLTFWASNNLLSIIPKIASNSFVGPRSEKEEARASIFCGAVYHGIQSMKSANGLIRLSKLRA